MLEGFPSPERDVAVKALRQANLFLDSLATGGASPCKKRSLRLFAEAGHLGADGFFAEMHSMN
jgi:hypothetical protein